MAVQTFTLLNASNRNGRTVSLSATIPNGVSVSQVRIYVDSANNQGVKQYTDPATHINLTTELSFDGGVTWQDDAGFTSDGGTLASKTGLPQDPEITTHYDPPLSGGTQVRGAVQVIGTVRFALMADVTMV